MDGKISRDKVIDQELLSLLVKIDFQSNIPIRNEKSATNKEKLREILD